MVLTEYNISKLALACRQLLSAPQQCSGGLPYTSVTYVSSQTLVGSSAPGNFSYISNFFLGGEACGAVGLKGGGGEGAILQRAPCDKSLRFLSLKPELPFPLYNTLLSIKHHPKVSGHTR